MAINHRKMPCTYQRQPGKCLNWIPCFEIYPPPPPPPPPPQPSQEDLSVFVSTLICILGSVILFLVLIFFLYLYVSQSPRNSAATEAPGNANRSQDEEEAEEEDRDFSGDHHVWRITTAGLQRSVINSITVIGFKKGEGITEGTECSVCLNEFEEDESLRLLPKCNHAFHIDCIDTWLLSHKNCPLCRAPILLTESPHQETESNHHLQDSGLSNDLSEERESSGSRNLSRVQSDLANHSGSRNVESVRRSFSIGGSSSLKPNDGDDSANTSRRRFYSSFSANFFSSSRRSRNQDSVLPTQMPSLSS